MADACSACATQSGPGGWKQYFALGGAFLFCPCHLPITFAVFLALLTTTGVAATAGWVKPLAYALFGFVFLASIVYMVVLLKRYRDHEARLEAEHATHHDATSPDASGTRIASAAPAGD